VPSRNPRLQVCLNPQELEELRGRARGDGLSMSAYARRCCRAGHPQPPETLDQELALTSLAALVASEHALRLLEVTLPDGARRAAAEREHAVTAAEMRLAALRARLRAEEE